MTFSYLAVRHMLGAADSSPAGYFPSW
jgi:hypothetical protein